MQCRKKFLADCKHNGSFLLNAPWQNPWSSGPWQNPWMLRFIISMGFAMELWENPLHGKTHISWVLPWYMGFAIDLWQNPWDTLILPRHAVPPGLAKDQTFSGHLPLLRLTQDKRIYNFQIPRTTQTDGLKKWFFSGVYEVRKGPPLWK